MLKPAPYILTLSFMLLLTSCSGLGLFNKKSNKPQQPSTQSQGSTIDQELNKHYQMYKEVQGFEQQQEEKVIKQSEERMKKLETESKKKEKVTKEKTTKEKKKKKVKKKKKKAKK